MRSAAILALLILTLTGSAQDSTQRSSRFNYGISPMVSLLTGSHEGFSPAVSFGGRLYAHYNLRTSPFKVTGSLGYKRIGYDHENFRYRSDNALLQLGLTLSEQLIGKNSISLLYQPSFTPYFNRLYQGNQNPNGPNFQDLTNEIEHQLNHGLYVGVDFDLNDKSSLEIGYSHYLLNNYSEGVTQPMANHLTIAINTDLGRQWKYESNDDELMVESLTRLRGDTLYFINRSCEGELSDHELDSMLGIHYKFSAYRVLDEDEIEAVRLQGNAIHYAIIGQYFASEGDPVTNGIYLLDHNMTITRTPYPFYTYVWNRDNNRMNLCFNALTNVAMVIDKFNNRMEVALEP